MIMSARKGMYRVRARKVIEGMKKRNFEGLFFETMGAAVNEICDRIPDNCLVGLGGSETIVEVGLVDALRRMNIRLLDRYAEGITRKDIFRMRREGLMTDVYIAGCNAITEDGILVNQDGFGNRVAAMAFGPEKVILIAGMNKVVKTLDEAICRIKTTAAPLSAVRIGIETPCARTGFCRDSTCRPPNRICGQLFISEASMLDDRVTVVLVGEDLGF
jgi:hypothetical protein